VQIGLVPLYRYQTKDFSVEFPEPDEAFDGAKIIAQKIINESAQLSVAYGWTGADLVGEKEAHYHEKQTEWVYIVSGSGRIIGSDEQLRQGDWHRFDVMSGHGFVSSNEENLILVAISNPPFSMSDVYFT
jgi:mannose-6-phosphate isomerase-like protein (cupin superfamily)